MKPCGACGKPVDEKEAVGVGVPPVWVHAVDCFKQYLAKRVVNVGSLRKLLEGLPQ